MTLVSVSKAPEWYSEVPRSIGRQTLFGLLLMGVTFGGFGVWAGTAPLASAVSRTSSMKSLSVESNWMVT